MKKKLYFNGHIHTMTDEKDIYSVMVTQGKRICYVGNEIPDSMNFSERTDLKGCHVYPGLTDSHLHLLYTMVLSAANFSICDITSEGIKPDNLQDIGERVRSFCQKNPNQKIITANGYIISAINEKRLPTRFELDQWSDGRAVIIYSIDGHSSALSTKLMELLELDTKEGDGIFSGEAHEFMQGKVTNLIASGVTLSTFAKGVANFSNLCAGYGITRVCALDGNEDVDNDILTKVLAFISMRTDIRVRLYPQYMDFSRLEFFRKRQKSLRVGGCGSWELDGSVGSHSAAFYEPYKDGGNQGHCYYSKEKISEKVSEALDKNIRLTCHAIGETAIDLITEVYQELSDRLPSDKGLMRIDHFEFPGRKAVEAVKKLPVALSVQPGFSWIDKHFLKSYEQYLSEDLINKQLPLKELADAGVCICGSSDSPVQSINPYDQMLGMIDFYLPEQSLTPYQALEAYTVNPSKMLGEEDTGTLEEGKLADFFVSKTDLLSCKGAEISLCKAEYTVIGGKKYKEKKGAVTEFICMLLRKGQKI